MFKLKIMIKNRALLGILFSLSTLFSVYGCTNENPPEAEETNPKTAKVVGYLSTDNFDKINSIQFCKITHLNLAFLNPDPQGNLKFNGDIDAVIKHAKSVNPNIKICISIGGGVLSPEQATNWKNLIDQAGNRPMLVQKMMTFISNHNLDGIDVDLEWDAVTIGYSGFVLELRKEITKKNKLLTAALPNSTRFENISQEALNAFDFINIMSYDNTGPWNPNKPGQHSSFEDAKMGIDFWTKLQNVPNDKLTLGVPFYGYDFTTKEVVSATYSQIIKAGNLLSEQDQFGEIFYNGRPTIEKKVIYASENTGGIMIWELAQDSFDQYSLLEEIHKTYSDLKIQTTGLCGN